MTNIRWISRRDMPQVLEIEQLCFEFPWSEEEFVRCLRQCNVIGMVAEGHTAGAVVGFMIYELHKNRLHILNFAVHPSCSRRGVGRNMMAKLQGKLTCDSRNKIQVTVRETNINACLFMKSMGFTAISVLRGYYEETDEDAILFVYKKAMVLS